MPPMKKVVLSIVIFTLCILIHAQIPESFNYQAIVRNAAGEPVIAQQVTFLFTVYKTSPGGTNVYSEKHTPTTNEFGLVTLAIGNGTDKTGDFSSIDWGTDNYYLNINIDPAGGTSYTDMGTTQLVSVPYALYADKVQTVDGSFFYRDKDGDGFGYMYESVWVPDGTDPPEHYVNNNGDCNDDDYFTQTGSAEVCDGADNDCDGVIDNGFCDENGIYNTDVACGNCYTDCQTIYDLPNAYGECEDSGPVPVCVMQCDPGYYDRDGIPQNGCEFYLDADAIYVCPEGTDVEGCGTDTGTDACRSITFGISEADRLGKSSVLVANGLYDESVTVYPGINLLGGYNSLTWSRDVENTLSVISGSSEIGPHLFTVKADGIVQSTTISGFIIQGATNLNHSGNTYGIYVNNSDEDLIIVDNTIYAGYAGNGAIGPDGSDGQDGNPGGVGANTVESNSYTNIFDVDGGQGGAGGVIGASGGDGGGVHGQVTLNDQQESGASGNPGGGGAGGAGGYNRYSDNCGTFATGGYSAQAEHGQYGAPGSDGASGTGGTDPTGTVISSHWRGEDGSPGGNGNNGSGGGGGGAGGGADVTYNCSGVDDCSGGTGGGGGSGAEGGAGGEGGESGGGSFCVFMINSSSPVLEDNDFFLGTGGNGGNGGFGGTKGIGGAGGLGGQISGQWSYVLGVGGNGGKGGDGGHGGGGGGGTGGSSFGIYTYNTTYTTDYEINNTFDGGLAGKGGSGGYSYGNGGQYGSDGVVDNCSYN